VALVAGLPFRRRGWRLYFTGRLRSVVPAFYTALAVLVFGLSFRLWVPLWCFTVPKMCSRVCHPSRRPP